MASDYTSKFSEKYGQLSGADLEILGAREQAATARALRTAFKPTQGQMVGGWYVKPALTQNLADALMQYNNYKNEQAGTAKAQELIDARKLATKANALAQAGLSTDEAQPAYDREVTPARQDVIPAVESGTTNSLVDEALAAGYGTNEQGQPLFDAAPTPSAAPIDSNAFNAASQARSQGLLDKSIQMQAQAKADADAATPLTSILNQGVPAATLGNAVRNAPLDNVGASINNQTPIPAEGTSQASQVTPAPQEQTLAPREAPAQPNRLAQMLRGEGDYAPIQKASVRDIPAVTERMPAVKGYNEAEWLKQQQQYYLNHEDKAGDAIGAYIKERRVAETSTANAATADRKVQREGELNREARRDAVTDQITNQKERDKQRAEDQVKKDQSDQAFRRDLANIHSSDVRRGQDMNAEVRREIAANKPEKPLTEYQGKSLAYGLRSQDANDVIEKIGTNYSPLAIDAYKKVEGVPGVGTGAYALLSDTDKQVSQAQRNFVNAVLRQESGAVISKEEFVNAQKQYFPQPGDDAATLQQKSDNRKRVISSFKTSAGRTVEGEFARPTPSAAPSAPVYIFNKATNKTMVSTDGEKTWKEVK